MSLKLALSLVLGAALLSGSAQAGSRLWRWNCQGSGINASGTFTTREAPNADGFYEITGITGEANGVSISGLQPTGTAIPGNDGYPVDNLVRAAVPQLTIHGFAFALTNGTYANPFYGVAFFAAGILRLPLRPAGRPHERTDGDLHRLDRRRGEMRVWSAAARIPREDQTGPVPLAFPAPLC